MWSGGLFQNLSYIGGNPDHSVSSALPGIRSFIFANGTGNVTALMGDDDWYGSYYVLGNFSVTVAGVEDATNFKRVLDLSTAVHTTTYTANNATFTRHVIRLSETVAETDNV